MIARIELTLRLFYDQFALICTDNLKNALGDESVAERVLFFQRNFLYGKNCSTSGYIAIKIIKIGPTHAKIFA